jgi:hypothetical protein
MKDYKVHQSLADNSVNGGSAEYSGSDGSKLARQQLPNTRMNDYVTNEFAGPGHHKGPAKIKGKVEDKEEELEFGNNYGL